jgi:hypothetical protein
MRPHTDQEWEELPHVLLTDDANWDPTHMNHKQGDDPAWYEQQDDPPLLNSDFNHCGDYCHCIVYKFDLTSDTYTPTGQILVHENNDNNISPLLYFSFYKPVYYLVDETTFPSESKEIRG